MKISGLQKLSMVDFNGHMAATIFVSGCNFACPFCHNASLVKNEEPEISEKEILTFLEKRRGLLDGVVVSGGEPTIYPDLPDFLRKVKDLGYTIKLDSNGTNPHMLKTLVKNHLIDYIAMDIKNSPEKYNITAGKNLDFGPIQESIDYIMNCGIDYEFRTTLIQEFHDKTDIKAIGKLIKNAQNYYLQKFEDSGNCLDTGLHEIDRDTCLEYQEILKKYIPNTHLRGY